MDIGNPASGRLRKMNIASRLERLTHQLKLIQLATEHPDHEDFLLTTISHGVDVALEEVRAIALKLKVELD